MMATHRELANLTRQKRSRRVGNCKRNGRCLTSPARVLIERRLPMARLVNGCLLPLQLNHHHVTMAPAMWRPPAAQLPPTELGPAGAVGFRSACGGATPCHRAGHRRLCPRRRRRCAARGRRVVRGVSHPRGNGGQQALGRGAAGRRPAGRKRGAIQHQSPPARLCMMR
jgi:hypothetical protein